MIDSYGNKRYIKNNLFHRENGPAVELISGGCIWFLNGLKHRLDGPALDSGFGHKLWYYKGQKINCTTQDEFVKLLKLKAFW